MTRYTPSMNLSVVAVIPAHNEAARLREVLEGVYSIPNLTQIIVVDDGSDDSTAKIARSASVELVQAAENGQPSGKGNALRVGLSQARLHSPRVILLADADLGSSASKLEALIPTLDERNPISIAVFPPAQGGGFGLVKSMTRRAIAHRTGHEFAEPLSGQRALLLPALDALRGIAPGFGAEVGMTLDLLAAGIVPREIPIPLTHRSTGKSLAGFTHRALQGRDIVRAFKGTRHPW